MDTKSLARVQIKDADQGTVTAVFSTFDVIDKDGDVTRKEAFTDGAPVVISAYGHRSWDGELPVGKGVIRVENDRAVLEGKFFMDTAHGRDAFLTVKELSADGLQEWSYSLQNVQAEKGEHDGRPVRILKRIDVKEVSPVLVGAGVNTRTLAAKAARQDLKFSEHAAAVVAAVDELAARASEVVALRAEKGKTISDESAALLAQVTESLERLKAVIAPPTPDTPTDDEAEQELTREFLRLVATTQGVTIP